MGLLDSLFGRKVDSQKDAERKLKIDQYSSESNGTIRVHDVFKIIGVGVIPVGEVIEGNIKPGYVCDVKGKQIEIKTIEMHHKQIEIAVPGDKIGFNVTGISDKSDIKRGDILYFHQK